MNDETDLTFEEHPTLTEGNKGVSSYNTSGLPFQKLFINYLHTLSFRCGQWWICDGPFRNGHERDTIERN